LGEYCVPGLIPRYNVGVRPTVGPILALLILFSTCLRDSVTRITEIAATDTTGWAHDVALEGGKLYLSDRQGGFLVFQRSSDWGRPRAYNPVCDVISVAPNSGCPVLASGIEGLYTGLR
jgi:hypothetical protein